MRSGTFKYLFFLLVTGLAFASCSEPEEKQPEDPSGFRGIKIPKYNINASDNTPGLLGVFDVPEMLSLCHLDSGMMKEVPAKVMEGFAIMEKEMGEIGTAIGGPQGIIYYRTDPNNFKFETVMLINKMPAKTPKNCQIVVLEASYMLIYNYVGVYEQTFTAYDVIRKYLSDNNLEQSGLTREFYPETTEEDSSKSLTRIFVPVIKKKSLTH